MPLTIDELEAEARHLSPAERAELAQRLLAGLEDDEPAGSDDEVEQAWIDEAERRYERYPAGETEAVLAADALAQVHARIAKR